MTEQKEPEEKQDQRRTPGRHPDNQTFTYIYERLRDEYLKVQTEYGIVERSKIYEKKETKVGCWILTFSVLLGAAVIFTPLRWYMAVIGFVFLAALLGSRIKEWDLEYARECLRRLEEEKQKYPSTFAAVLQTWVNRLPKNDRARKFFESAVKDINILEPQFPPEDYLEADEPGNGNEREEYGLPEYEPVPVLASETSETSESGEPVDDTSGESGESEVPGDSVILPLPPERIERIDGPAARKVEKDVVICPRCGSDWIRYEEKKPGKFIYICEECGKKWRGD